MEKKITIREEEEEGMKREISKIREAAHVLLTKKEIHKYIIRYRNIYTRLIIKENIARFGFIDN